MNEIESQEEIQEQASQRKREKSRPTGVPTGPGETWQPEAWTPGAARR